MHEQLGHGIAVEHDGQDALHGLDLCLVGAFLELGPQLSEGGRALGGTVLDETVCIVEERHDGRSGGSEPVVVQRKRLWARRGMVMDKGRELAEGRRRGFGGCCYS